MSEPDLKELLKKQLFDVISAQIDAIGYVPADLEKMIGSFPLGAGNTPEPAAMETPASDTIVGRLATNINELYDAAFYDRSVTMGIVHGDTDFKNIGYWNETTRTQDEASIRLQDALLNFIPEKSGRILDVACGKGASTRRLLNHYPAEKVWAINISALQIESTRLNAPGCHAAVMNAVELTFDEEFFDNVMCIEAAFHFETRERFFREAWRILKPGGRLVLSDVLFTSRMRLEQYPVLPSPGNHLESIAEYHALLAKTGFRNIIIKDETNAIWRAHFLHVTRRMHALFFDGQLDLVSLTIILWRYYHIHAVTGPCYLISAQK